MTRYTRWAIHAACGLVLLSRPAAAQGGGDKGDDREQERTCKKVARIIAQGHVDEDERWAYGLIVRCPGATATLASAWGSSPSDTNALHDLAARSRSVADRRIVDAILLVVRNTQLSQVVRRIAIDVLLAQYDPATSVGNATWKEPEYSGLGHASDYYQIPGEQPVTAADRQRIVEAFREMGVSDPDPQVQRVAKRIFTVLSR